MQFKTFFEKFKKHFILLVIPLSLLIGLFTAPNFAYRLGNIFFGSYPSLYNVNLAQHLYKYSAYPFIGSTPEFAHYQLSRTYFIQGKFKLSIAEALAELQEYPNNKRTYYILGLTYGYVGREEEAIDAFGSFIEEYPHSWAARNDRAWLQFRIGDIEGALETIEPVSVNLNPWIQNTYGTILLNLGRYDEAEVAFRQGLELVLSMSDERWGNAYPGNDPRIYQTGLEAMKSSIESNLKIITDKKEISAP